jgi:hypothetical protein
VRIYRDKTSRLLYAKIVGLAAGESVPKRLVDRIGRLVIRSAAIGETMRRRQRREKKTPTP